MDIDKIHSIIKRASKSSSKTLDLQDFHLPVIPTPIYGFKHLKSILLYNNRITSISEDFGNLRKLVNVNFVKNNLDELPKSFSELKAITRLNLRNNRFEDFPTEILSLTKLSKLNLRGNSLKEIPQDIGNLKNLRYLDIGDNQIESLPESIGELSKLQYLIVDRNNLNSLPSSIGNLKSLQKLILNSNAISIIPPEIEKLSSLNVFEIGKNPIGSPPLEISNQGIQQLLNYYISLVEETALNEAKLLIVGQGDVGKTFLMKRLVNDQVDLSTPSTEGIEIGKWIINKSNNEKFKVNVWDFGGQEIYHSTHQFFLTKRSIYLLVWEARKDDDLISFDYWLNVLKLLSDDSPVIIVQNKIDIRTKHVDEATIKEAFKNIKGFQKVSALTGVGIEGLKKMISKEILELDHVGDKLPKAWVEIRKKLEGSEENYISYSQYLKICETFGLNNKRASFLSQYFHDLGVFLHFDENEILKDIIFLKPDWATNAVYKVIDTRQVIDNYGRFSFSELKSIWIEYPVEKYIHLLELMKKFEICFQISSSNDYIVPELLRVEKTKHEWSFFDNLKYEYHYEFMPAGIIARFIVRVHDIIYGQNYWKNGVVIKRENNEARIINVPFQRKIKVWVTGDDKPGLLQIIRREFDFIHDSLNDPIVKEMIPCICDDCNLSNDPFLHNYEALKKAKAKNIKDILCQKSVENISIGKLLGGIDFIIKNEQTINLIGDYIQTNKTKMKIKKIVNKKGSRAIFADRIAKIVFDENNGMDKMDFELLLEGIKSLSHEDQEFLEAQVDAIISADEEDSEREGLISRAQNFLIRNGVPIAQGYTGTVIFEVLRHVFS